MAALIPDRLASAPTATAFLTVLVLAFMCFLAGLLAQTARRSGSCLGSRGPYFEAAGLRVSEAGGDERARLRRDCGAPGRARRISAAPARIGVQTDHVGEDLVAVFLPNSPNPLSGSVFFVAADPVRPSGSLASAIACLRRSGTGPAHC